MFKKIDLVILAGESSGDLHGANWIEELLAIQPSLRIAAVAGPKMRAWPIQPLLPMEELQVMGFTDVLVALPRLARHFFQIRDQILSLNPKGVVCIDYPGFHLRLARSLRKRGFQGKLIHAICPTVWAWGKKRIPFMAKYLDLLLTLFPFEKECFKNTSLPVAYIGHPLTSKIAPFPKKKSQLLALFPGSRSTEIARNFPIQLQVAKQLKALYPEIEIAASIAHPRFEPQLKLLAEGTPLCFAPPEKGYALMQEAHLALATSGTVALELALYGTPTVVHFFIRPIDRFIAQRILRIDLPHYCIVNIIAQKRVFPELFGPHFTSEALLHWAEKLWVDEIERATCQQGCREVRQILGNKDARRGAAEEILNAI